MMRQEFQPHAVHVRERPADMVSGAFTKWWLLLVCRSFTNSSQTIFATPVLTFSLHAVVARERCAGPDLREIDAFDADLVQTECHLGQRGRAHQQPTQRVAESLA
jgi:hypothetical protein